MATSKQVVDDVIVMMDDNVVDDVDVGLSSMFGCTNLYGCGSDVSPGLHRKHGDEDEDDEDEDDDVFVAEVKVNLSMIIIGSSKNVVGEKANLKPQYIVMNH